MLDKSELRKNLLTQRLSLGEDFIKFSRITVIEKLEMFLDWPNIRSLHAYLPIVAKNEIDTLPLIEYIGLNKPAITIAVPFIHEGNIAATKFNEIWPLARGQYGFPEPIHKEPLDIQFDVIIVPVLGFDSKKQRLGYGKGYYDRFLKNQPGLKIGLAYSQAEIKPELPAEPHDVPMDYIITEKEVL